MTPVPHSDVPGQVAVTAAGIWSAAGCTPEAIFESALAGRPGAVRIRLGSRELCAGVAPEPPPIPAFPLARRMDRSVRLALAAAEPAVRSARLRELPPARVAVLVGNSRGPVGAWSEPPARRVRPTQATHTAVASLSGALSLAFQFRGPCLTLSATCCSSAHAIAFGELLLRGGLVDAVLAGGAEAPLVPGLLEQFEAAGIVSHDPDPARACRPFDVERSGMVPAEGAAFLVLERADHARARGIPILAHLSGSALGSESFNRVAAREDGSGLADVILLALEAAGLAPSAIGHVNAHGTGTRINDLAEARAFHRVFGASLPALPVTSTKPVTGHTFGAAADLEAVLTVESLRRRLAPPTVGFAHPDPALGLVPVHPRPRPFSAAYALSTSLGFWGNVAALVFSRPP